VKEKRATPAEPGRTTAVFCRTSLRGNTVQDPQFLIEICAFFTSALVIYILYHKIAFFASSGEGFLHNITHQN
jgi:hypothetical protein